MKTTKQGGFLNGWQTIAMFAFVLGILALSKLLMHLQLVHLGVR